MTDNQTPSIPASITVYPAHVNDEIEWERRLLTLARRLRHARKRFILEVTEQGIILCYELNPAGRLE